MDWDDLRYILKVAETGDLWPAGRFLRVNAATVDRHIEALEEAPGRRLFVRTQRGYGLMEAGECLLQWSRRLEGEWDRPAVRDPLRHAVRSVRYLAPARPLAPIARPAAPQLAPRL
jgi:DNA-binding transcriptional LysR family regulator